MTWLFLTLGYTWLFYSGYLAAFLTDPNSTWAAYQRSTRLIIQMTMHGILAEK